MVPTKYNTIFCTITTTKYNTFIYHKYIIPIFGNTKSKSLISERDFILLTSMHPNEAFKKYYPEYLI